MSVRFVYGVFPAFITWTYDLGAEGRAGVANGLRIRIRPDYAGDRGLLEHELQHVRRYVRGIFCFWERPSHLELEVEAYRVQLDFYPEDDTPEKRDARLEDFAERLSRPGPGGYGFGITQVQARDLLLRCNP